MKMIIQAFIMILAAGACHASADTDRVDPIRLTLPPVVYAVEGEDAFIYFDNIMDSGRKDISSFDVAIGSDTLNSKTESDRWGLKPTAAEVGDHDLSVSVRDERGRLVAVVEGKLHVAPADAGKDDKVTLLIVGDSLTAAGKYPARLAALLNREGNPTWEMQGTVPAENGAFHEGYGGNTWKRFVEGFPADPKYSPFFYSRLDFKRYLKKNEDGKKPDIITVTLGINDNFDLSAVTPAPDQEAIDASVDAMFSYADKLIKKFRSVCPDAEIGIGITPPANARPGAFQSNYGDAERAWKWKDVQRQLVGRIIAEYQGREDENLYLVPFYLNLDSDKGFPPSNALHPNEFGYNQMGDSLYAWLKWRMEERER